MRKFPQLRLGVILLVTLHMAGCHGDATVSIPFNLQPLVLTGPVTTIAGQAGTQGSVDGSPGTTALFSGPFGLTLDGDDLYVMDSGNHRIRHVDLATTAVTTFAGSAAGYTDGPAASALFNSPRSAVVLGTVMYIADYSNNRIRTLSLTTGTVGTLAGSGAVGTVDGIGLSAVFQTPRGLATDGTDLFVIQESGGAVRHIDLSTTQVTTIAGSGAAGYADGPAASAQFSVPTSAVVVGDALYISDGGNNRIRRLDMTTSTVTTFAGNGTPALVDSPTGLTASFFLMRDMVSDGFALFLSDRRNHAIRRIDLTTTAVTTIAGDGTGADVDGPLGSARFNEPYGIVSDGVALYICEALGHTLRRID